MIAMETVIVIVTLKVTVVKVIVVMKETFT